MTLDQYIAKNRSGKKIPADIMERWKTRVLPRGLQSMGEAGAQQYLRDYGRGIAAPKLIHLAQCAEAQGHPDMARGFWRRAYEMDDSAGEEAPESLVLETPAPLPVGPLAGSGRRAAEAAPSIAPAPSPRPTGDTGMAYTILPAHLRPGALVTMQPADAPHERDCYIRNPSYWCQPKRDGQRLVVMAAPDRVFYQRRSMVLTNAASAEIDEALKTAAQQFGPFVLDCEEYYPDVIGGEHRTGAQAARINVKNGRGDLQPQARIAIFKALYAAGQDLTGEPESERIAQGELVGAWLVAAAPASFEVLPTARTIEEKIALVGRQKAEGREGEVWVRHDCRYRGGRDEKSADIVRTKYICTLDVVVLKLTPTNKKGRPFGAIEVGVMHASRGNGPVSIGSVGTGFTQAEMEEIAHLHAESPGQVVIAIGTQGFTETGQVWHGRFIGCRRDKRPENCTLDGLRMAPSDQTTGEASAAAAVPIQAAQLSLF